MKTRWKQKSCGCVKADLELSGRVLIRCTKHRGKASKKGRRVCFFDENGIVRSEK